MAVEQSGAKASPAKPEASAGKPEASAGKPEASAGQPAAEAAEDEATAKPAPDLEETKRKFREALERKQSAYASAQGADHTGKVHGAHGPAPSRRSFRRKSG